jgi:hypothetical protein
VILPFFSISHHFFGFCLNRSIKEARRTALRQTEALLHQMNGREMLRWAPNNHHHLAELKQRLIPAVSLVKIN